MKVEVRGGGKKEGREERSKKVVLKCLHCKD